jgi:hypothetical protein
MLLNLHAPSVFHQCQAVAIHEGTRKPAAGSRYESETRATLVNWLFLASKYFLDSRLRESDDPYFFIFFAMTGRDAYPTLFISVYQRPSAVQISVNSVSPVVNIFFQIWTPTSGKMVPPNSRHVL